MIGKTLGHYKVGEQLGRGGVEGARHASWPQRSDQENQKSAGVKTRNICQAQLDYMS